VIGSLRNIITGALSYFIGFTTILGPLAINQGNVERTAQLIEKIKKNEENKVTVTDGQRDKGDCFEFRDLVCVTPTGRELNRPGITAKITKSDCTMLMGPSGSGKSSLLRVLAHLWPFTSGQITQPPKAKVFFVPQKPYMVLGTLRDQLIYPHTATPDDTSDSKLLKYMEMANLTYLLDRFKFDDVAIWNSVLSPGEQQRLAFARLFYHSPDFAILDESTNALDPSNEYDMYRHCSDLKIALISVGHRESLLSHHNLLMIYDGKGGWEMLRATTQIDENAGTISIVDDSE